MPKAAAMNPPPHARLEGAANAPPKPTVTTDKEAKKREARTRRRDERKAKVLASQTARPSPPPPATIVEPSPVAAAVVIQTPHYAKGTIYLPEEVTSAAPLLFPHAAKGILESLAAEHAPPPLDLKSPEAILSKHLGDRGPTAKEAKRIDLEAAIRKLKSAIVSLSDGGEAVANATAALKSDLDAKEAALLKLQKDAPSQEHQLKALAEGRSSLELSIQERKDREQRGAAKAADRRASRASFIADLKAQVAAVEAGLTKIDEENTRNHRERAQAAADLDAKALALFDKRLADKEAEDKKGASTAAAIPPAGAQQPLALAAPPNAQAAAVPPEPGHDISSLAELEAARIRIATLEEQMKKAVSQALQEFERVADVDISQLPAVEMPPADALPLYGGLFMTLQNWTLAGAQTPLDYTVLRTAMDEAADPIAVAKLILADAWDKWYPASTPILTSVVPRQVAVVLLHRLTQIKLVFEGEVNVRVDKLALEGTAAVQASGKRLRVA